MGKWASPRSRRPRNCYRCATPHKSMSSQWSGRNNIMRPVFATSGNAWITLRRRIVGSNAPRSAGPQIPVTRVVHAGTDDVAEKFDSTL